MSITLQQKFVSFFESWKSKHIYQIFITEALLFFILYLVFTSAAALMESSAYNLSGGKSPDELKQMLVNGSADQAQEFLSQLKGFFLLFVAIIIALPTFFIFSYSLVQAYNWNFLLNKALTRKNYWRWNGLNLAVLLSLAVYLLVVLLIKFILSLTIPEGNFSYLLNLILSIIFIIVFFYYLFLVHYHFVQHHKIWISIAAPFQYLKQQLSNLSWSFLFSFLTLVLLSLLQMGINWLFNLPEKLSLGINVMFFLFYLAWLRVYVLRVVEEKHS